MKFDASAARMARALREFRIHGVKTNIPFLLNVLQNEKFLNGKLQQCSGWEIGTEILLIINI